ncbi:MAG: dihydrodipicolinate synthase family protein [Actinomycetota bacterium]|nr:dihydrodipicolinate synthase family protein [Actinomycetota bacterium]
MVPLPDYLPALITPFSQRGELDTKAHTRNVRVLADQGIDGFLLGGSTGEGPYLEPGDRAALVRAIRRRKAHLMVGIAAESTRAALALVDEATEAGADSLLVMTPTTLARGRDDAVVRYYKTIADRSKLPILLYSVPPVTAYNLPVELISRLSRHENIVGMKDSAGDVVRLQSIIDATPRDFILYSGSTKALTAALAVGCHGAITASGNYAPGQVLETLRTAKDDPARARRMQKRISALSADIEAHGVPGVKAAARAAGLEPGYPRAPLARLPRGAETSIAKLIS